jgi:tRNA pseudouridine65 synthase
MLSAVDVLYRDAELLVVSKPSGLLTHRGWANDRDTALTRARTLAGRHVHPVHRLDRATSGVLVFALTEAAAAALGAQLEAGDFDKRYLVLVRGITPDQLEVDYALRPLEAGPDAARKPARSSFRRLGTFERYSLLEATPHTGRSHQLRRHLKHVSHPVLGDTRYGDGRHNRVCRERFALHRLALHAADLTFTHPRTAERLECHAPLPPDLAEPLRAMDLLDVLASRSGGASSGPVDLHP